MLVSGFTKVLGSTLCTCGTVHTTLTLPSGHSFDLLIAWAAPILLACSWTCIWDVSRKEIVVGEIVEV
jgi:hypothetical protein